jgi:hypothetical protein
MDRNLTNYVTIFCITALGHNTRVVFGLVRCTNLKPFVITVLHVEFKYFEPVKLDLSTAYEVDVFKVEHTTVNKLTV